MGYSFRRSRKIGPMRILIPSHHFRFFFPAFAAGVCTFFLINTVPSALLSNASSPRMSMEDAAESVEFFWSAESVVAVVAIVVRGSVVANLRRNFSNSSLFSSSSLALIRGFHSGW